jgi:excisionase family DNA binding protein
MPSNTPQQLTIDDMFVADEAEAEARTSGAEVTPAGRQAAMSWLSPGQAAERTPLSRKAIYGAIRRRELRASKRCGRWMIRQRDLEAWFADGVPEDRSGASAPRALHAGRPAAGSIAALRAIEEAAASQASATVAASKNGRSER